MHSRSSKLFVALFAGALLALSAAPSARAVAFAHNPASGYARAVHNQTAASRRSRTAQRDGAPPPAGERCAPQPNTASPRGASAARNDSTRREGCSARTG